MSNCTTSYDYTELEWYQEKGYRWAELPVKESGDTGFKLLSSSLTGITFNNRITDRLINENQVFQVLLNGSGVASGDIDGDGLIDLYFTRLDGPNKLYKNLGGYRFEEITESAGVTHEGFLSTGAVFADVNGNGYLDLLVSSINKENSLYLNDGTGHFELKKNSGLGPALGSMTMALADITGDGLLDLYITNYKRETYNDLLSEYNIKGFKWQDMMEGDSLIAPFDQFFTIFDRGDDQPPDIRGVGEKDALYINQGEGVFKKVENPEHRFLNQNGSPEGLERDWGLAAKFQDLDGDGFQDLYVANDFWTPDRIWMNQGDGTFRALDTLAIRNGSFSSMAVDFSDINRDGLTDIFVVEMLNRKHKYRMRQTKPVFPLALPQGAFKNRPLYNRNSLYLNRGEQRYSEISYYSGLEATDWSWAVKFLDVDLDGFEDIIVNNGYRLDSHDMDSQIRRNKSLSSGGDRTKSAFIDFPTLHQVNRAFRNNGDLTFQDVSTEWNFYQEDMSFGMAAADLNNTGVMDLIVSRMDDESVVYKNITSKDRVAIRLKGDAPNTQAVGSTLKFSGGPVDLQSKQITSGGDYLSNSDPIAVFAASAENKNHKLTIHWPDGKVSHIHNLHANKMYEIDENSIDKLSVKLADRDSAAETIFKDATVQLNHIHHENSFDDFSVQPLLPIRLSQMGPGMAWLDLNNDRKDELLIGSGKGGEPGIYERKTNGNWQSKNLELLNNNILGDQTGLMGWIEGETANLVIGYSNFEADSFSVPSALHIKIKNFRVISADSLFNGESSTGPVAGADYTGDGLIDLFLGGAYIPAEYPKNASSKLFVNKNGNLVPDEKNTRLFQDLGLVSGAVFVDYDLDSDQDLILSTEWGPVRLFENNEGTFKERTEQVGFDQFNGLWRGIATGDFTGNGYPDLIVTNRGENSSYQLQNEDKPLKIFYEDLNWDGILDIVEAYYDKEIGDYVPRRQIPELQSIISVLAHLPSHQKFSKSSLQEILRIPLNEIPFKSINTVQHMIFINKEGNSFEAHPLPDAAQFSAGFHVATADYNSDGMEDLFLSQNFFAMNRPQSEPRLDAGYGLWLKGDGTGKFLPVTDTGVLVYGEQRGAALSDFNEDGKVDMAVSQNASTTRLFINESKKRGIRIRLVGPSYNINGVGSRLRLIYEDGGTGPTRNIQAGSGYLSMNSTTQILGFSKKPLEIEVIWFDGKKQTIKIDEKQFNYLIRYPKS